MMAGPVGKGGGELEGSRLEIRGWVRGHSYAWGGVLTVLVVGIIRTVYMYIYTTSYTKWNMFRGANRTAVFFINSVQEIHAENIRRNI